ncbi:MAG: 5-oxoprolinase subunit PxpA [Desulfobacteraceae bacterium]|nr:5-oxoprolinase subunit PxpA [Desulfobacteraceae bacterium]
MDLNCDMGESFGAYKLGMDEEVMQYITSANIACGWHAGDPLVMDMTVEMAIENNVAVGAHPGYPDLLGFGRRSMSLTEKEIRNYLLYQIGALNAFCKVHGVPLQYVKPHGALYLDAVENKAIARAVAEGIMSLNSDLYFVAFAGKKGETMRQMGKELGLRVVYEAFPDRAYTREGTLVSRKEPGAVISDPDLVAQRALDMSNGFVKTIDDTVFELEVQTLCVHGDNLAAVDLVKNIKIVLETNGVKVTSMGKATT